MRHIGYVVVGIFSVPFFLLGLFLGILWAAGKWACHKTMTELSMFIGIGMYIWLFDDYPRQGNGSNYSLKP